MQFRKVLIAFPEGETVFNTFSKRVVKPQIFYLKTSRDKMKTYKRSKTGSAGGTLRVFFL